jgi:hypothetical protein
MTKYNGVVWLCGITVTVDAKDGEEAHTLMLKEVNQKLDRAKALMPNRELQEFLYSFEATDTDDIIEVEL